MEDEKELIQLISAQAKVSGEEVRKQIEEKEFEFSGMVSREGAIFLVAREYGIDLLEPQDKGIKIKNIVAGMNSVSFFGKVIWTSQIREFENDKGKGKVASIVLGDETGTIRLSLWNEKTEAISKISRGDYLEVQGAYTKSDNKGQPEARIGRGGNLRKVTNKEANIPNVAPRAEEAQNEEVSFDKIIEGQRISAKAYIVHIYDRQILYSMCPQCRKKLQNDTCNEHGKVVPSKFMVLSAILDDGTGTINAAFFNKTVEALLGKSTNEIESIIKEKGPAELVKSASLLGKEIYLSGFAKKNSFTGKLELSVNSAKEIDTVQEINKMLGSAGAAKGQQEI